MAAVASTLLFAAVLVGVAALQGVAGVSILACFNSLEAGHYIENGVYRLVMGDDCELVLTRDAQLLWREGGNGSGCLAHLEGSGDLVIKDSGGTSLWRSNSKQVNRNYLILDNKGNVSIKTLVAGEVLWFAPYPSPGPAPPPPSVPGPAPPPPALKPTVWEAQAGVLYMVAGYRLPQGTPLQNGIYLLRLNTSCYLELQKNGIVQWQSETGGSVGDNCTLLLRENGNLQILGGNGAVAWQNNYSGPAAVDSYVLFLGDRGDLSIFNSLELKTAVWTGFEGSKPVVGWWRAVVVMVAVVIAVAAFGVIFWVVTVYYGYSPGWVDPAGKQLKEKLQATGGSCQVLSLAKIRQATSGFKTKLGEGGFGPVYYGKLSDGQEVAIKVLSATSRQGKKEFFNEIELLSVVHHRHLVSLVGYCRGWKKHILVYEYINGGDLHGRLHGEKAASNSLSWKERTSIMLQVAEGIEYLHHGCPSLIIHRDLKSSNILLTDRMIAKVADFGLSKQVVDEHEASHITTLVKGTIGYLDPEYSTTGNLTEKSDVYAFGVVLMETLTGRPLTDKDGVFIGTRVRQAVKSGQVELLADPNMRGVYDVEQFSRLMKLGTWCVKNYNYDRPSMSQVVQELRDSGVPQLGPLKSMATVRDDIDDVSFEGLPTPTSTSTTFISTPRLDDDVQEPRETGSVQLGSLKSPVTAGDDRVEVEVLPPPTSPTR